MLPLKDPHQRDGAAAVALYCLEIHAEHAPKERTDNTKMVRMYLEEGRNKPQCSERHYDHGNGRHITLFIKFDTYRI